MLRRIKYLLKEPKAKFCYKCGEELITYTKKGVGSFSSEEWLMLSCPQMLDHAPVLNHFSTILKAWDTLPEYDIYTGRKLDGSTDSFRR